MNTRTADIVILGAGISGLSAAYYLSRQGFSVAVLEKSSLTGGAIRSQQKDGFLIESGPNSTLETTPLLKEMFTELGITDEMIYANDQAKNRYIVRDGKLQALPMSPGAFLKTPLFSAGAKLRLLKEPFIKAAPAEREESLAEFVRRRLGREFLDYAINPFVAGVYAGQPEQLSVKNAFPKLHQLEQKYGSLIKGTILGARERKKRAETSKTSARLLSFRKGLQTLPAAIHQYLGDQVFTSATIKHIRNEAGRYFTTALVDGEPLQFESRAILSTIPAYAYNALPIDLQDFPHNALQEIKYPPVTMVFLGYHKKPDSRELDGFGFLVPAKEQRQILGTIWSSTLFPERSPEEGIALTTFVGGSRQPSLANQPPESLEKLVREDLKSLLGIERAPDFIRIKQWPLAIPQYKIGHHHLIAALEKFEAAQPGFFFSGNFRGGISVGDCIKQSHLISETMATLLHQSKPETVTA